MLRLLVLRGLGLRVLGSLRLGLRLLLGLRRRSRLIRESLGRGHTLRVVRGSRLAAVGLRLHDLRRPVGRGSWIDRLWLVGLLRCHHHGWLGRPLRRAGRSDRWLRVVNRRHRARWVGLLHRPGVDRLRLRLRGVVGWLLDWLRDWLLDGLLSGLLRRWLLRRSLRRRWLGLTDLLVDGSIVQWGMLHLRNRLVLTDPSRVHRVHQAELVGFVLLPVPVLRLAWLAEHLLDVLRSLLDLFSVTVDPRLLRCIE